MPGMVVTSLLALACSPGVTLDDGAAQVDTAGTGGGGRLLDSGVLDTGPSDTGLERLPDVSAELFDDTVVHGISLAVASSDMTSLSRDPYSYVPAELSLNGVTWAVGVRLKGSSSYQSVWDKPNWKVDADRYVADQRVHGVKKFNLHNNAWDASHLAEALSYGFFRQADSPAPRVGWANVIVNGDNYGLYTLVEAPGDALVERWVDDATGNLYEANNCDFDVAGCGCFETEENDEGDHTALQALCDVARMPVDTWEDAARKVLDWDRFMAFVATEIGTQHWDGYSYDDSNYRVFHQASTDRWFWIPWSTDLAFGWAGPRTYDDPSCDTYGTDPRSYDMGVFARRCQDSETCEPELLDALQAVADRMEAMDHGAWITARMDLLRPYVQSDPRDTWGEAWFDSQGACIQDLLDRQPGELRDFVAAGGF